MVIPIWGLVVVALFPQVFPLPFSSAPTPTHPHPFPRPEKERVVRDSLHGNTKGVYSEKVGSQQKRMVWVWP